jgi:hypothetical protein
MNDEPQDINVELERRRSLNAELSRRRLNADLWTIAVAALLAVLNLLAVAARAYGIMAAFGLYSARACSFGRLLLDPGTGHLWYRCSRLRASGSISTGTCSRAFNRFERSR